VKTPPFGKPLKALLQSGQIPLNNVYVYIGNLSWEKGKSSSICRPERTLILPPSDNPVIYDWPVKGCDILIIETSMLLPAFIEDVVYILFRHEAIKVTSIAPDFNVTYFKKDF
jgi:hypothetical protein